MPPLRPQASRDTGGITTGAPTEGADVTAAALIAKMRETVGGPYAHWPAPDWNASSEQVRLSGASCSGYLDWALTQIGMGDSIPGVGGTYQWANIDSMKAIDLSQDYPVGTVFVSTTGDEGHLAVVSGPGNTLIQSDTYHATMNEGTLAADQQPYANYEFAGAVGGLPTIASGAASAAAGIAAGIDQAILHGLIMFIRWVYYSVVIRPYDIWNGFAYELALAIKNNYTWKKSGSTEAPSDVDPATVPPTTAV